MMESRRNQPSSSPIHCYYETRAPRNQIQIQTRTFSLMNSFRKSFLFILVALIGLGNYCHADKEVGSIIVLVAENRGPAAGVTVFAKNIRTEKETQRVTDTTGAVLISNLPFGIYEVGVKEDTLPKGFQWTGRRNPAIANICAQADANVAFSYSLSEEAKEANRLTEESESKVHLWIHQASRNTSYVYV